VREQLLGAAVAATRWEDAPAEVRDRVVDLVADTVAVAALGSGRRELRALVDAYGTTPEGAAAVPGSSRGWPASTAALLTGCGVAADQLQDGHRPARGHPASHVATAVIAVAQERGSPGAEVLSAVLAGYEAGVRVGRAMGGTPAGVHDIGTWGEVAAAVGAARLLAPGDAAAATRAIGLAAGAVLLTDAGSVFGGATGGHLFLGLSVQAGVETGRAAVAGLAPLPGALDRHLAAVAAAAWDPEQLVDGVGQGVWTRWEVLGGYVKSHPTCAHLHGVNDAVADLVADGVRADDVASVEVLCTRSAAAFAAPAADELQARFSVPTSVAVALVTGGLDATTLTDALVRRADVVDLAGRVRVVPDPVLEARTREGRPARVVVTRRDGSTTSASSDRPRGDADRFLDRDALRDKASRLLRHRFGPAGDPVLAAVHALATGGTAAGLADALRSAAGERP
jgi:2-methylcitrate dehydratase PrpD